MKRQIISLTCLLTLFPFCVFSRLIKCPQAKELLFLDTKCPSSSTWEIFCDLPERKGKAGKEEGREKGKEGERNGEKVRVMKIERNHN